VSINWKKNQPAPLTVWNLVSPRFPVVRWLGIFVADADDHGEGRAVDLGLLVSRPEENILALSLVDIFHRVKHEVGWDYLVYDQFIYYNDSRGQQRGGFKGDHTNHIHVSWSRAASQKSTFPQLIRELDFLATGGGVEDEGSQSSYYAPYSS
jgi:hypothetical protein